MVDAPRALLASALLCCSCAIMVCAWYLHLKFSNWSASKAILFSWLLAGGEYCLQVPANRIGSQAGLSAAQLRAIAEIAILLAFVVFQTRVLSQPLLWNHVVGLFTVLVGVLVVLGGPFSSPVFISLASDAPFRATPAESLELVPRHPPQVSLPASPPGSPPAAWPMASTRSACVPVFPDLLQPKPGPSPLSLPPSSALVADRAPSLFASAPSSLSRDPVGAPPSAPTQHDVLAARTERMAQRMALLAESSREARLQALRELHAGQKRGHWIWWAFPTLGERGGDMNSHWTGADLQSMAEAAAYAQHADLRAGLGLGSGPQ